ncbi:MULTISPECIES: histidine kinase [unclassified Rhodococcus (in: high G+C Gram-positive bacteria)]|uniref:histidine kinase n=2 Tax=Rhodococcus TaxID=1827 RepID=UPI00146E7714|nr:sensor histidine kinase [Rhodococcus sp. BL-253-APC-6A1W]NME80282.1 sensor histidine kinase [Rhodococcus sp. 105337]
MITRTTGGKAPTISAQTSPAAGNMFRQDRTTDALLAGGLFAIICIAIAADLGGGEQGPPALAFLFGALFAAPVFFRRQRPVTVLLVTAAVLVAYYALGFPPIGLALPLAVALYSAAESGHLRWAIAVSGALVILSTAVRMFQGDDLAYLLGFESAGSVGLMAAVIALGDSVRSRRALGRELVRREHAARLEREREAARRVERERLQIARDLHDLLAHTVSVISLHTDVAAESLDDDPALARRSLVAVRDSCSRAVSELHATVEALRSPAGTTARGDHSPTPGLAEIPRLVDTVSDAGVAVHIESRGTPATLPAVVDATAYRVIQEALSNVLRHSDATRVVVALDHHNDVLRVCVSDNGRGSRGGRTTGWGLTGMRERVALLGGTVDTGTPDGGGFVVDARIPAGGPS